ncbi:tectonic isoform X2 [Condylostylus longicornis]|nr:tectonic isoform X2 [Condylostylus longicornis]
MVFNSNALSTMTTTVSINPTKIFFITTPEDGTRNDESNDYEDFNRNTTPSGSKQIDRNISLYPPLSQNPDKLNKTKKEEKRKFVNHKRIENYFCDCDMQTNYCNINCCCDIDCKEDMLKVFKCDERKIMMKDLEYRNNLESCKLQGGWFCEVQGNELEESNTKFNLKLLNNNLKHQWNSNFLHYDEQEIGLNTFYKYQDSLKIYLKTKNEILNFDMPYPLVGKICNVFEPIHHLVDMEYTCLLSLERYRPIIQRIQNKLSKAFLIQVKKDATNSPAEYCSDEQHYTHCSKINVFSCPKTFTSLSECQKIENTSKFGKLVFWDKIEVELYHNYTHLNNSTVLFILKNEDNIEYSSINLKIKVKFIFNDTNHVSIFAPTGGPLGYKIGFPIIIGNMNLLNKRSEELDKVWTLDYFHPNKRNLGIINTKNLMTSSEGICQKSVNEYPINFGENSIAICKINFNASLEVMNETNYQKICTTLQSKIFYHILNMKNITANHEIFVSKYGNPRNNTKFWTRIELKSFEPIQILGEYNKKNKIFICKNIILGVKIGFVYAKLKIKNIQNQNIIKSAFYKFEERVNLHFDLNEVEKFSIYSSIMFYDITDGCKIIKPLFFVYLTLIFNFLIFR